MNIKNKSSIVAFLGVFTGLALILAFIESQIPPILAMPGIKIGLPNIAIIVILYKLDFRYALSINIARVIIISLLFGTMLSFIYSLFGAIISTIIMALLKEINCLSIITVSIIGAVRHNVSQIILAIVLFSLQEIIYYLPLLLFSAIITGILIGICGYIILKRIGLFQENV